MRSLMNMKPIGSSFTIFLALLIAAPLSGSAQGEEKERSGKRKELDESQQLDVSEEELETLVNLDKEMRSIQINSQKKLRKNIEKSEISQTRFKEIRRAQRSGDNPDMTEEEKKSMKKIEKKNKQVQEQMKKKMKEKVKANGMEWERYRELRKGVGRQPELRQRYRKKMKEEEGGMRKRKKAPKQEEKKRKKQNEEK